MNMMALHDYFDTVAPVQHKLGALDCVRFVTDAVFIGWGRDYRAILQYNDRRTAISRLRALGGLKGACSHAMGEMYMIDALSPGDVVYFDKPSPTIGLLMEHYVLVKQGTTLHRLEREPQIQGWRT